ncbi:delta 1-pyrroline-5-carboxylate synthetase [Methanocaldococcus jannaschii DSM 2661]|uniref:[5-(aminomethyl)furan-3-yl]methyl phosphate kinase n=1 Tax=Methanocaldococcus jannaschii (strain ATCC 43067 / DSM 2661 / JAL-1 / JCM 10045 / NBRC 100440) TaxID=243232 RepID=MFNE_METJA|nr:[5-(aminomethyl)furan-3-yl]methyl phosphate kinase [Methanocaldococcus jannaschii]Q57900.1 RecName: Full=[5-(aminomethyl)furan-3-yl]methyl phosphate kinase; AltName: Full=5-(aminomethyl)-3-furanmethanol phosphate kinase [Methanocaldococcus jannaschii DSM 2661]AAB98446.1 delta 1-pyrroline-5-carboxylate synthetase [Methanocaldococcus jannaschii DSM 2661]
MHIVKIGGSLTYDAKPLLKALKNYAKENNKKIVIIPGGGEFANVVRKIDKALNISNSLSHKLAIKCMDLIGEVYAEIGYIKAYDTLFDLKREIEKEKIAILLPSKILLSTDIAEHSWAITSDSLSLYIGKLLDVREVIIATDVDGIYDKFPGGKLLNIINANDIKGLTSVDETFPILLKQFKMNAYVVNGRHPERVMDILEGKHNIYTKIVGIDKI